jgi:hypothetical protein
MIRSVPCLPQQSNIASWIDVENVYSGVLRFASCALLCLTDDVRDSLTIFRLHVLSLQSDAASPELRWHGR